MAINSKLFKTIGTIGVCHIGPLLEKKSMRAVYRKKDKKVQIMLLVCPNLAQFPLKRPVFSVKYNGLS